MRSRKRFRSSSGNRSIGSSRIGRRDTVASLMQTKARNCVCHAGGLGQGGGSCMLRCRLLRVILTLDLIRAGLGATVITRTKLNSFLTTCNRNICFPVVTRWV